METKNNVSGRDYYFYYFLCLFQSFLRWGKKKGIQRKRDVSDGEKILKGKRLKKTVLSGMSEL